MHSHVQSRTIHNTQGIETTSRSTREERIKKMWYIHNGAFLSHKKEWNKVICSNMDRPRVYHTKQSK